MQAVSGAGNYEVQQLVVQQQAVWSARSYGVQTFEGCGQLADSGWKTSIWGQGRGGESAQVQVLPRPL